MSSMSLHDSEKRAVRSSVTVSKDTNPLKMNNFCRKKWPHWRLQQRKRGLGNRDCKLYTTGGENVYNVEPEPGRSTLERKRTTLYAAGSGVSLPVS